MCPDTFDLRELFVVFDSIPLEELEDIPLWTECDDVADIDDYEASPQPKRPPKTNKCTSATKKPSRRNSISLLVKDQTKKPDGRRASIHVADSSASKHVRFAKTSETAPPEFNIRFRYKHDDPPAKPAPVKKSHIDIQNIKEPVLLNDNLSDLIPEQEEVDYHKLFYSYNKNDSDSVSDFSDSDASDIIYQTPTHRVQTNEQLQEQQEKNIHMMKKSTIADQPAAGQKLDFIYNLIPPIAKSDIANMPAPETIFKCQNRGCGYTTNSQYLIKYHTHTNLSAHLSLEQQDSFEQDEADVT